MRYGAITYFLVLCGAVLCILFGYIHIEDMKQRTARQNQLVEMFNNIETHQKVLEEICK